MCGRKLWRHFSFLLPSVTGCSWIPEFTDSNLEITTYNHSLSTAESLTLWTMRSQDLENAEQVLLSDHERIEWNGKSESLKHVSGIPLNISSKATGQRLLLWLALILYLPLALVVAWKMRQQSNCSHPDLLPSPARESGAIAYETRRLHIDINNSPFAGNPSLGLDKAWHEMLESNNIKVSKDDLLRANLTSLELADGSGYVAQLGFYHQLHCLKRVRHWIYKDYYHKHDTEEQAQENKAHVDHCIELLRQASLCHADMSLTTFRWFGKGISHPTAEDKALHQCVRWDTLRPWILDRAVHLSHNGTLKDPADSKFRG